MKNRIIICHDTYSSPKGNWYGWLADALEAKGHSCYVPTLPTPAEQSLQMWNRALWREVGKLESDYILVGHGVGAAFIFNVLHLAFRKISGIFLVSGFCSRVGNANYDINEGSFVSGPFDWEAIRRNTLFAKVYHGDNDPIIPLAFGEELASQFGVKPTVVNGAGHFDSQAGATEFPLLLNDILALTSQPSSAQSMQVNP